MAEAPSILKFGAGPAGMVTPGHVAPPARSPIMRFGTGIVPNTPLNPDPGPESQIDPTVTQEQLDRYHAEQMRRQGFGQLPDDARLLDVAKAWGKQLAPMIVGGGLPLAAARIPGMLGAALRTGLAGAGAGGTEYAINRDPTRAITTGALTGAFQVGGEALAGARNVRLQQAPLKAALPGQQADNAAYRKALVEYEAALPGYERALGAHTAAQTTAEANAGNLSSWYKAMNTAVAATTHEAQATKMADTVKGLVKPWADVDSSAAGISRMIGPEWKRVREAYDQFLKGAIPSARGQKINIPADDLVIVDAGEALEHAVGKSLKSPRAYHQVAKALDEAGIGDPAIRKMYFEARSFKEFAERNRIVENGVFHPERVQKGIAGVQSRRAGDIRQTEMDPVLREATPFETVA